MDYIINDVINRILKDEYLVDVFDVILTLSKYYKRMGIVEVNLFNAKYHNITVIESFFRNRLFDYEKYNADFYICLCYASIMLYKNICNKSVTYGITVKKIKSCYCPLDYLELGNVEYKPLSIELAELIKYSFFVENSPFDCLNYLSSFDLNLNDYILLLSELLWPSYFIELFKKNGNGVVYEHILENLCKYFKLILCLIDRIKNRYNIIPVPIDFIHLF
ncbi:MAG: hypothetical protein IKO78_05020 [Bacilli bacterium]|nr:hypothetical protein [Bacilli bacterium]